MASLMLSIAPAHRHTLQEMERVTAVWRVTWEPELDAANHALKARGHDLWLVDASLLVPHPMAWIERAQAASPNLCVVIFCAEPSDTMRDRLTWLELGAYDVVRWDDVREEMRLERLSILLERILLRSRRASNAVTQRDRTMRELESLHRFVRALGGTLDERSIASRVVELFLEACHRGAVSYIELVERRADEAGQGVGLDALFSESETDLEVPLTEGSGPLPPRDHHTSPALEEPWRDIMQRFDLRVVEQAATDRLLVCLGPTMDRSWAHVIAQRQPVLFRRRPGRGELPGLDPLWHRLEEGEVFIVPLWSDEDPLGLLVVAELEPKASDALGLGANALFALSSIIGRGLESARRYMDVKDAYKTLQAAQDQLLHAEKFAAVGHLAAQIAHEINNPASFVISNLSVMREYATSYHDFMRAYAHGDLSDHAKRRFEDLRRERDIDFIHEDLGVLLERSLVGMQRIHQIVKDLSYLAHDSGPELGWLDVQRLLTATINLVRPDIKYRAHLETSFGGETHILSDANKLSQVFLNLLVNASQALEHGDPEADYIRVGTLPFAQAVLVYVEDSGVGMDAATLPHIFEPFFTTKRRGEGSGLGLSISRDIMRSLGGDIRVYSEPGKGTRFEVMIPLRCDLATPSADLHDLDDEPRAAPSPPLTESAPLRSTPMLPFDPKKKMGDS